MAREDEMQQGQSGSETPEGAEGGSRRQQNARRWGFALPGHLRQWYDVEAFKAGTCSLRSIERAALGDVSGKRLLHLQCNAGLDTLSWARRGAEVVGVDLSQECIDYAQELQQEVDVPGRFLCCDVLDLDQHLEEQFDIVFASYGVFCWIDDVDRWMLQAAARLKPGGTFYYVGDHPACWPYAEDGTVAHSYFHLQQPLVNPQQGEQDLTNYEWQWTVADLVNAAIAAGLRLEELGEYPVAAYRFRRDLVPEEAGDEKGWWRLPGKPNHPLLLSILARKGGS